MLAKIVATRRSSADQLRVWLSYRLTAPIAAPSASMGIPATAWIPAVLAAMVYSGQRSLASPAAMSWTVTGCVDATASMHGPFCQFSCTRSRGGDRLNGGGDESLLAVVDQRHARSGQGEN